MQRRYGPYDLYWLRLPRNPWLLLAGLVAAGIAASVVIALIVALLAVAATAAVLMGGAWVAWQIARAAVRPALAPAATNGASRKHNRELRGLLELAAAPDPMEQYLIAVREFERISMAAITLDPEDAGGNRVRRRSLDLAEQAQNLDDAVTELEHRLVADRAASGAHTHVWELALAVREVEQYLTTFGSVRGRPSLATLRALVGKRATLTTRRGALVDRLEQVQVTRELAP